MRPLLALLLSLVATVAAAQQPYLVKDIRSSGAQNNSSNPTPLAAVGSTLYFSATTIEDGAELWKTDGTAQGTTRVTDLAQGPLSSYVRSAVAFGSSAIFVAGDSGKDALWITDGTPATTRKLASPAGGLFVWNGLLYFGSGGDLWVSDGTPQGTHLLADLKPDSTLSPALFKPFGNRLAFSANGLWLTDGTAAGTQRISDAKATDLTAAGDRLYFVASDARGLTQLWVSDGTAAGTHAVPISTVATKSPFAPVGQHLVPLGNRVVLFADDLVHGGGPWVSDGTAAGTFQLAAGFLPSATASGVYYFVDAVALNDVVFMTLTEASRGSMQLWRTDGTVAGTTIVPLDPGMKGEARTLSLLLGSLWVTDLAGHLWRGDATATRWVQLTGCCASSPRVAAGTRVYFSASDPATGSELWSSDGTPDGTAMVANLQPDIGASSSPEFVAASADRLYFSVPRNSSEKELWASDGTEGGTSRIAPLFQSFALLRGAGYFAVNDRLYRTEGTAATTTQLQTFGSYIRQLFVAGDVLYIAELSNLWASDGTTGGTALLATGYLTATSEFAGQLLLAPDMATDGVHPPHRIFTLPFDRYRSAYWVGGGTIYMVSIDPNQTALHFWKSNGTNFDTKRIIDFTGATMLPPSTDTLPLKWTSAIATTTQLFFALDDGQHGRELWRTDGTAGGTRLVKDIRPGPGSSSPDNFAVLDDQVVFTADDGVYGTEMWISDGTEGGTLMLKDIAPLGLSSILKPGSAWIGNSGPMQTVADGGSAWFAATDGIHGGELWRSDGTAGGTTLAADIAPGPPSSWPQPMAIANGRMFLSALTPAYGRELWALPGIGAAISIGDVRVSEAARSASLTVSLSAPSTEPVTASWSDDEGEHGTLRFEPGQTRTTINVAFQPDGRPAGNRAFYVRLKDIRGAAAAKSVAAVLLEDADIKADLAVSLAPTPAGGPITVSVTNLGPSDSMQVILRTWTVFGGSTDDLGVVGAGVTRTVSVWGLIRASVSALELDPNPSNNSATAQQASNGVHPLALTVIPAWLSPDQRGSLVISDTAGAVVHLTSSNPAVIAVPATVTAPATIELAALAAGTTTITAEEGAQVALTIFVIGPGQAARWPARMTFSLSAQSLYFGTPRVFTASVPVPAFDTGDMATGTVTFSANGQPVRVVPLNSSGTATATIDSLLPGNYIVTATYSGDAHFFPDSASTSTSILPVAPAMSAALAPRSDESGDLTMTVRGVAGVVPTGTISAATTGGLAIVTSAPLESGSVTRLVALAAGTAKIVLSYSGDLVYPRTTATVNVSRARTRAVR